MAEPRETPFGVVAVATDGSGGATRAVAWAAEFAASRGARLHAIRVITPDGDIDTGRLRALREEVEASLVALLPETSAVAFASDDVAAAIVDAAEQAGAELLVVGNSGMHGRKDFLLGNVANRVTHLARCTVTVVNTGSAEGDAGEPEELPDDLKHRAAEITRVLGSFVAKGLAGRVFGAADEADGPRRLREALEALGPTFEKMGQVLSTRPDLIPAAYLRELASLQSAVPPMTEADVVTVMEQELGVPWEDVFGSIDPAPLAAGTIGQVHRATLADGTRVVVKVQRPSAARLIDQDLTLLEAIARPFARTPRVRRLIDVPSVVEQLGSSLRAELDFGEEAGNLDRMAETLETYGRLGVPRCYHDLSSARLLVMDEVMGVPVLEAPPGPERTEAARELLHAYYQQVLEDGFFHADPHPGNLMWGADRIWLLDLGMVGRLDAVIRQQLTLLLLAFAQSDAPLLADLALDMAGGGPLELDRARYEADLRALAGNVQGHTLEEIQLADLLNQLTEISVRHGVPLPSSLVMVGKALAQVQLTVADLAPELDPLAEAGRFFARSLLRRLAGQLDPRELVYQAEKLRYRAGRITAGLGRVGDGGVDLRLGSPTLERSVALAGRTVALGLSAGLAWVAATVADGSPRTSPAHKLLLRGVATGLATALVANTVRR